jgi:hypothetical protein
MSLTAAVMWMVVACPAALVILAAVLEYVTRAWG